MNFEKVKFGLVWYLEDVYLRIKLIGILVEIRVVLGIFLYFCVVVNR